MTNIIIGLFTVLIKHLAHNNRTCYFQSVLGHIFVEGTPSAKVKPGKLYVISSSVFQYCCWPWVIHLLWQYKTYISYELHKSICIFISIKISRTCAILFFLNTTSVQKHIFAKLIGKKREIVCTSAFMFKIEGFLRAISPVSAYISSSLNKDRLTHSEIQLKVLPLSHT